ncbi:hypothetical protein [Nocardiopsis potens]|uniref:hypothetical protein n=1 Tax=Nocardiopsis potens TaxID=1246458 RepID=UPI000346D811|nr:hypothetical protein [Nocardiopsis potens]
MTDLYAIRVLAVDPPHRRIRLRVTAVDPDVRHSPLPDGADFFRSDLEEDEAVLDLLAEEEGRLHEDFVVGVERIATRNHPFTAEAEERLRAAGTGFPWEDEGPLGEMSPEAAANLVRCEEVRMGADYDVLVADPRLIGHLKAGQWWRTAAFPGAD